MCFFFHEILVPRCARFTDISFYGDSETLLGLGYSVHKYTRDLTVQTKAYVLQLRESTETAFFGCLDWLSFFFKLENPFLDVLFHNKTKQNQANPKRLIQIYTSTSVLNPTSSVIITITCNDGHTKRRLHFYSSFYCCLQPNTRNCQCL